MDEIWKHFDAFSHKMGELAPVAYEKLVLYEWATSLAHLIIGGVCLLGAVIFWSWSLHFGKLVQTMRDHEVSSEIVPTVLFGMIALGASMGAAVNLLSVWNWVGVFMPEARIVHDFMQMVAGPR